MSSIRVARPPPIARWRGLYFSLSRSFSSLCLVSSLPPSDPVEKLEQIGGWGAHWSIGCIKFGYGGFANMVIGHNHYTSSHLLRSTPLSLSLTLCVASTLSPDLPRRPPFSPSPRPREPHKSTGRAGQHELRRWRPCSCADPAELLQRLSSVKSRPWGCGVAVAPCDGGRASGEFRLQAVSFAGGCVLLLDRATGRISVTNATRCSFSNPVTGKGTRGWRPCLGRASPAGWGGAWMRARASGCCGGVAGARRCWPWCPTAPTPFVHKGGEATPVAKAVEKVVVAWACEGRKEAMTIAVEEVVVPWPVSGNLFLETGDGMLLDSPLYIYF